MPANSTCPAFEELRRLLLGQIGDSEARPLEEHLEHCERCVLTLNGLRDEDTLVEALQRREDGIELPHGQVVESLIEQLCLLRPPGGCPDTEPTQRLRPPFGGEPPTPAPAEPTEELWDFLGPPQGSGDIGRLGPYRVLKMLGAGGMGVVYQAEDSHLKRAVALKVMKPALAASDSARRRFLREAQAAAAIEHDHIVSIYQVGEDRGLPYLAMQLLKGETLHERARREGRLPVVEVLRIGREIAAGLAAAHRRGLVHRDIKPPNIWLEAGTGRVKILDFGLAREAGGEADVTQRGVIVGTPAYMAPEQATDQVIDARCDLFSLGCVLYRLCTGQLPFHQANAIAVLVAVANDQPPSPQELNPEVPQPLSDLVMHLLAKDPADRPLSADMVVDALAALEREQTLGGFLRPGLVHPNSSAVRTDAPAARQAVPKSPWARVLVGVALLLGALALAALWWAPLRQRLGGFNQGQLIIDTDDDQVELNIKQGRTLVLDHTTRRRIDLNAGEYDLEIAGLKPGWQLSADKVRIQRGGQSVVRVQRDKPGPDTPPLPPD